MRTIVTGGAGFIGSHIADAFIAHQHEVLVIDDLSTGLRDNVPASAEFMKADIRDKDTINKIFDDFRPNFVSHQAAQTSVSISTREPVRDAEINIMGSLNIIEASVRQRIARLVFASTGGAIYGEVLEGESASVDVCPSPLSPYACAKLAVENYLYSFHKENGFPYTILRYANVYGPRQNPHGEAGVVAIFTQRILNRQPVAVNAKERIGDAGCIRDYVYVGDVVQANVIAMQGAFQVPIINLCTGVPTTTLELLKMIEGRVGIQAEIHYQEHRPGDLKCSVLESNLSALLEPMVSLKEGIQKTVEWFQN